MNNRNITLSLPRGLLKRVKVLAAERDTSISAVVAELLEQLVSSMDDYDAVWRREREVMRAGLPMRVGEITWTRDQTHERPA